MRLTLTRKLLADTFDHLRTCGDGRRECQALWVGPREEGGRVTRVVHPRHSASAVGFQVDNGWLSDLWEGLAAQQEAIRVQVHTHPAAAYHSHTDDAFPIIALPGFLSLVIPNFAQGEIGFERAFLARMDDDHRFREVPIADQLEVLP